MYRIELINKKTKQVINYDDVVDLNDGEKMFFKFQINTKQLDDGEYTLNLYDDDTLIKTDTLNVGDFNAKALQYKRGEDIYVETKIDVELTNKFVELSEINSTIYPDEGDGMLSVTVDATPLYNKSKEEGIEIGYADGKQDGIDEGYATGREEGIEEQKSKLSSINITENGEYSNEDGYNEITVDVQPNLQEKYVNVTDNNTTVTADDEFQGLSQVNINATPLYNSGYNDGKSEGVEQGYNNGYAVGSTEGYQNGVQVGYNDGYATGKAEGITTQRDLMTTLSVRSNGVWRRDDGYNEVDVNVESFSYLTNTVDVEGLSELGWSDDDINYFKDNTLHYEWQNKDYIVSQGNKNIVITSQREIQAYKDNPDFEYCPYFEQNTDINFYNLFNDFKHLKAVPLLDASKSNTFISTFKGCTNLITIPPFDTKKIIYFDYSFYGCKSLKNIPLLDLSSATSLQYMFSGCSSLETVPLLDTSNIRNMYCMFNGCTNLKSIPLLNTSNVTSVQNMFTNCTSLKTIPLLDLGNVTYIQSLFQGCTSLETVPLLNLSNLTDTHGMFKNCANLTSVPLFDLKKLKYASNMFDGCTSLKTIPEFDLSSLKSMSNIFSNCSSLVTIPTLNLSNVTDMKDAFNMCTSLVTIPDLNLSNVTDMSSIFYADTKLTTVGSLNCPNATNVSYMLYGCTALTSIGLLDFSSVSNIGTFFGYGNMDKLTDLGGFKGLKINWNDGSSLTNCPNLTKQSVLNVINNLYNFRENGDSTTTRTIKFHKNSLALLSDDEKAIATAKGWVLTS